MYFYTNGAALCRSTLICVSYSREHFHTKPSVFYCIFPLRFPSEQLSARQSCFSSVLRVQRGALSGHGSVSLYIHITDTAVGVMRTDGVDQHNVVVEPNCWIKNSIT